MIDDTNLFCRKTEKENSHFRRGFPFHILLEADIILLRFLCIWTFIFLRNKQEHLISQDQRFNIVLQNLSYCLSGLRSLLCAFSDWNTTLPLEPFLEPSKEIRRRMLGEISNLKNLEFLFAFWCQSFKAKSLYCENFCAQNFVLVFSGRDSGSTVLPLLFFDATGELSKQLSDAVFV
jgi:hypothetical protein